MFFKIQFRIYFRRNLTRWYYEGYCVARALCNRPRDGAGDCSFLIARDIENPMAMCFAKSRLPAFPMVELPAASQYTSHRKTIAFTMAELPAASKRKRNAFTLVELLVVIGI